MADYSNTNLYPGNIIKLNRVSHLPETPMIILKTRNLNTIGEIKNFTNWSISLQANALDEISFDVCRERCGEVRGIWDRLVDLAVIEVRGYGHFEISVSVNDAAETVKTVVGQSLETELGQLMLYDFHVNDDYAAEAANDGELIPTVFYNPEQPKYSLLHRVLADKAPHWSIGHVPDFIAVSQSAPPEPVDSFQRVYTADGVSIYDFLMSEVAVESNVIFVFDTYERSINCYNAEDYIGTSQEDGSPVILDAIGEDTTIFVDKDILAKQLTIYGDKDSVKNCFRVSGGDDIITDRIRAVNMDGTNYIMSFSDLQWQDMPPELTKKLKDYQSKRDNPENQAAFYGEEGIFTRLCSAYDRAYLLESGMMPNVEKTFTTADEQYRALTDGFAELNASSGICVYSLNSYTKDSFLGITNKIEAFAKCFVDSSYQVEVISDTSAQLPSYFPSAYIWRGRFRVSSITNASDTCSTPAGSPVAIRVGNDTVEYSRQKVLITLQRASMQGLDFDSANMSDNQILEYFRQYCRTRLQSFYEAYETCVGILSELSGTNRTDARSLYEKYAKLKSFAEQALTERQAQIEAQTELIRTLENELQKAQEGWALRSFLGEELYKTYCQYRREDEYQNSNYTSENIENDAELSKRAKELLDTAKEELKKACVLQRSISTELSNLLLMEEFAPLIDKFAMYNFIRVGGSGEVFKLRLVGVSYDSNAPETVNVTFSEAVASIDSTMTDLKSIYSMAGSIASSYASTVLQAKSGKAASNEVARMRTNGLNAALTRIRNDDSQEVTLGSYGLLCREQLDDGSYSSNQVRLIGKGIYMTTDNWQSVRACLGETTDGNYGLIADTLIGRAIFSDAFTAGNSDGSVSIDGKGIDITNGSITLSNAKSILSLDPNASDNALFKISKRTSGNASSSNSADVFYTDADGNINMEGRITANSGTIGGWEISSDQLSCGSAENNNFMLLKPSTKTILTSGTYGRSLLTDGALKFEQKIGGQDIAYAKFNSTYWMPKPEYYGVGVNSEAASKFISFGNKNDDSDTSYNTVLLLNYGLNPYKDNNNPNLGCYTEDVIMFGNTRITGSLFFGQGDSHIYGDGAGSIYTDGSLIINGHSGTSYALFLNGSSYIAGNLNVKDDSNINGDLFVNGDLNVSGTITGTATNADSAKELSSETSTIAIENNYARIIMYTNDSGKTSFRPSEDDIDKISLGNSSFYWNQVYSKDGIIKSSDQNRKKDISSFSDKHEAFFHRLAPVTYKLIDGASGRTHFGFISQDVEDAMTASGLTSLDFAGFCKDIKTKEKINANGTICEEQITDSDGNPEYIYALRYEEFISLNTHMIQKLYTEIEQLKQEINKLKEAAALR